MTRWGFDRKAGSKRRPVPLVRAVSRARALPAEAAPVAKPSPVARERIDLSTASSEMEALAASWRRA